ncbi:hypothetical protein MBH78_18940 [Oceanimonas sp. NS1]|nr:hypothetical protein [Oceanimonas sp. NS1]
MGGGNLLEYVGEDRVIASGNLAYTFTSGFVPINDIVRFTLAVKETESGTSYQFRNLGAPSRTPAWWRTQDTARFI